MTKTIDAREMDLFVAEQALSASLDAVEVQGRGGLAWALFKSRADKVRQLRRRLTAPDPAADVPGRGRADEVASIRNAVSRGR